MTIRRVLTWTAGFLAFPIAGLAGRAVVGPVDDPVAAVLGGGITGLVIGAGQVLAAGGRLDPLRWVPATGVGMAAGLGLGATAVGYGTSLGELAAMGALTGLPLGVAQALALPLGRRACLAWAVATVALWALGWTVTTAFGIDVESRYTVFGATGAITVSLLSGLLLERLWRGQGVATPRSAAVRRRPAQVPAESGTPAARTARIRASGVARRQPSRAHPVDVGRNAHHTVAVVAGEIGLDQVNRDRLGLGCDAAGRSEDRLDEAGQLVGRDQVNVRSVR